jgi:rRNA maturation endonuclease Nob1
MTETDKLKYCEICEKVTPHTFSGSENKDFCQECGIGIEYGFEEGRETMTLDLV